MIENADPLRTALENARISFYQGNHSKTRYWARIATKLDPNIEEPWLWLAAVSSPRASVAYLQKALIINPNSKRAKAGMHWAIKRIRTESPPPIPKPVQKKLPVTATPKKTATKTKISPHWLFIFIILSVTVTCALVSPALGFYINSYILHPEPLIAAQVNAAKASNTPTPSSTPTVTPTSTPTNTPTPTPTDTPTPTPTDTPTPTYTPYPTDTPAPTWEPIEYEPPDLGIDGRWIDVDLTYQLAYAYDGNELVRSFVVSTGTWQHPTVTGQYHIYVKYEYADMAGPGYYLPDVPYVMYFYDGYGLHGTYWHNNFGTPMSHGCVNFTIPDAEWLFYWSDVGTLVNVHY